MLLLWIVDHDTIVWMCNKQLIQSDRDSHSAIESAMEIEGKIFLNKKRHIARI